MLNCYTENWRLKNVIFQDGYKIQDGEYISDTNIPICDPPNLKRFFEGDYNV